MSNIVVYFFPFLSRRKLSNLDTYSFALEKIMLPVIKVACFINHVLYILFVNSFQSLEIVENLYLSIK